MAVQYNLLNLPYIVQFADGNQIVNHYDALGNRYRTTYHTRKVPVEVPLSTILSGTGNLLLYSITTHATSGNLRYESSDNGPLRLDYVFNSEGYFRYSDDGGYSSFYYIRDHLGSIRETYSYDVDSGRQCVQRMQYYPSGLPWDSNYNASEQPYKYNGKEFVEMSGLDTYDYGFRGYTPSFARFTTMDVLMEKEYGFTPYSYAKNQWINNIDFMGLLPKNFRLGGFQYTEIDEWGKVTEHIDNDDDRVVYVDDMGRRSEVGWEVEGEEYEVGYRAWFYTKPGTNKRLYYNMRKGISIAPYTLWEDRVGRWLRAVGVSDLEAEHDEDLYQITVATMSIVFSFTPAAYVNDAMILFLDHDLFGRPVDAMDDKSMAILDATMSYLPGPLKKIIKREQGKFISTAIKHSWRTHTVVYELFQLGKYFYNKDKEN